MKLKLDWYCAGVIIGASNATGLLMLCIGFRGSKKEMEEKKSKENTGKVRPSKLWITTTTVNLFQ